jgi:Fe-S cluster biogenesis protein NfuA
MTVEERIEQCLQSIRPFLHADGGDVKLVRFRPEGVLEVRWEGMCSGCPLSAMTLRAGIERALLQNVPEVNRIEAVSP